MTQADYMFYAKSDKANRELDWQLRQIEQTFREVLNYKLGRRKQVKA